MKGTLIIVAVGAISVATMSAQTLALKRQKEMLQTRMANYRNAPVVFDYSDTNLLEAAHYESVGASRFPEGTNEFTILVVASQAESAVRMQESWAKAVSVLGDVATSFELWVALARPAVAVPLAWQQKIQGQLASRWLILRDPWEFSQSTGIRFLPSVFVVKKPRILKAAIIGAANDTTIDEVIAHIVRDESTGMRVFRGGAVEAVPSSPATLAKP